MKINNKTAIIGLIPTSLGVLIGLLAWLFPVKETHDDSGTSTPGAVVKDYYHQLNEGNLSKAYEHLSKSFKIKKSLYDYKKNFKYWSLGHLNIIAEDINDSKADVYIHLECYNADSVLEHWKGNIALVFEDGVWRIETQRGLSVRY